MEDIKSREAHSIFSFQIIIVYFYEDRVCIFFDLRFLDLLYGVKINGKFLKGVLNFTNNL